MRLSRRNMIAAAGDDASLLALSLARSTYPHFCALFAHFPPLPVTLLPSTPLSLGLFGAQVPVAVAVGGGASAALTVAPETLAARCRATLRTELRAGNAACCAELLVLLTRCEAPWLAPLAACVSECAAAQQSEVERACAAAGIRLDEALEALAKLP